LKKFAKELNDKRTLEDLLAIYETYYKISKYLNQPQAWPTTEVISNFIRLDHFPSILYKELYFRNLSKRNEMNLEGYFETWENYSAFFEYLLKKDEKSLEFILPSNWIWDLVNNFIEGIQSFHRFRSKLNSRVPEEIEQLKNNPKAWNIIQAINYLQSIVKKSNIIAFLKNEDERPNAKDISSHPVYKMMGYFSLVNLLRLQCLLGDYRLALQTVASIELTTKSFSNIPACHITFFYYVGFAYLMMGRYVDAIKTFSSILTFINKLSAARFRNLGDQIENVSNQIYGLLSICISLCPQRVDEQVRNHLKDLYEEKMNKMRKGDRATFESVFLFSCPPFINPTTPDFDSALKDTKHIPDTIQEFTNTQMKLFWNEVSQQTFIPNIRSFLKLYTTIEVKKLANFLEDEEANLRTQLICYKNKTRGVVWSSGPLLAGERVSIFDVDFSLDKDMIHVQDEKVARRYSEYFVRQINKFEDALGII